MPNPADAFWTACPPGPDRESNSRTSRTWTVSRDFPPLFPWSSPPGTSIPGPCWEASRKSWITCASCTRRPGAPHDPETGKELVRQTPDQIADALASLPEQTRLVLTAPAEALLAQDPAATLGDFQRQGFLRIYWNGEVRDIEELGVPDAPAPDAALVIDRIIIRGESSSSRLADSLQTALRINPDEVRAVITRPEEEPAVQAFHTRYRNPETGYLLPQLTPRHFSFNSPLGACPACHGTGLNKQENGPCPECRGQRLSPLALAVTMHTPDHAYNLAELTALPLEDMVGETKRLEIPGSPGPRLESRDGGNQQAHPLPE